MCTTNSENSKCERQVIMSSLLFQENKDISKKWGSVVRRAVNKFNLPLGSRLVHIKKNGIFSSNEKTIAIQWNEFDSDLIGCFQFLGPYSKICIDSTVEIFVWVQRLSWYLFETYQCLTRIWNTFPSKWTITTVHSSTHQIMYYIP